VVGGTALATVLAVVPGSAGVTAPLTPLSLSTSVVGTISSSTVDANGLHDGVDVETDEDFRRRLIQRWREPPGPGTKADYERWAGQVPGVTRAWCLPGNPWPGAVAVTFVCDNDPLSIIPSDAKVAEDFGQRFGVGGLRGGGRRLAGGRGRDIRAAHLSERGRGQECERSDESRDPTRCGR